MGMERCEQIKEPVEGRADRASGLGNWTWGRESLVGMGIRQMVVLRWGTRRRSPFGWMKSLDWDVWGLRTCEVPRTRKLVGSWIYRSRLRVERRLGLESGVRSTKQGPMLVLGGEEHRETLSTPKRSTGPLLILPALWGGDPHPEALFA